MTLKKTVLVVGCSYTQGHGLKYESADTNLWVNKFFPPCNYQITNAARSGANNHWIFLETMSQMIKNNYDIVLVGWTSIPRFNFHVGLELYTVSTKLRNVDVNINNNVTISGKWLNSLGDNLRKIHNDHWDLLNLVKYVNVLIKLQEHTGGKIVFVNSLGPWSNNYFESKLINLPSDLSEYEQNLLQVDTRDDQEIFRLYKMIHNHYDSYGGIRANYWLNLYQSLRSLQIDPVSDTDDHPGYKSQEVYSQYLGPILEKKLISQ
jgi:hypothetical protein